MARGERQEVTQRRVVDTQNNPNRYNMPDQRRLRVHANPLRIFEQPAVSQSAQLAQALAQVKPELMERVTDKQSDDNAEEYNKGTQDALKGLPKEEQNSHWRQIGYERQSALLVGEELGAKLESDLRTKDPEQDFESWYSEWWKENGTDQFNTPESTQAFNKLFSKSVANAVRFDAVRKEQVIFEKQASIASENIYRAMREVRGKGLPFTTADYRALKTNLKGFTNAQTDELFLNSIERYGREFNDPDALNVLYEKRGDVPAMVDNPKYTAKITQLRETLINSRGAEIKAKKAQMEKAVKSATEDYEKDARFQIIELADVEDPVLRSQKIDEIISQAKRDSNVYNFSTGFLSLLNTSKKEVDKTEASEYQKQNYRTLYNNNASLSRINRAVDEDDINHQQWKELVKARERRLDRNAKRSENKEKPVESGTPYKEAEKTIKSWAGYNEFDTRSNATEKAANYQIGREYFRNRLEHKLDAGIKVDQAVEEAKKEAIDYLKEHNLASKERKKVERDIRENYINSPELLLKDMNQGTLGLELNDQQIIQLQHEAVRRRMNKKKTPNKATGSWDDPNKEEKVK